MHPRITQHALVWAALFCLQNGHAAEGLIEIEGHGWHIAITPEQLALVGNKQDPTTFKLIQAIIAGEEQSTFLAKTLQATYPERQLFYDYVTNRRGNPANNPHILFTQKPSLLALDIQDSPAYMLIGTHEADYLAGDERDNWLAGLAGIDSYDAGTGDDILLVENPESHIKGGEGIDSVVFTSPQSNVLNLAQSDIEIAFGHRGNDILIGGGRSSVYINAGAGDDIVIGGAANDVLVGDLGSDLVDGGAGNDLIYGGEGQDQLLGGTGDDILLGQQGDDRLNGSTGNDVLEDGAGDDTLEGNEGVDMAAFTGNLEEYRLQKLNDVSWRISDRINARDGSDILVNIETLYFKNTGWVDLTISEPIPVADAITLHDGDFQIMKPFGNPTKVMVIDANRLTANDISMQPGPLKIQAIADKYGKEIRLDNLGDIDAGSIMLTSDNKIVFSPTIANNFSFSFNYILKAVNPEKPRTIYHLLYKQSHRMAAKVTLSMDGLSRTAETSTSFTCEQHCVLPEAFKKLQLLGNRHINGNGNSLDNLLIGNPANNILDGAEGEDIMIGGAGNDTYYVDHAHDMVKENANDGNDTVYSNTDQYQLPEHVENLILLPDATDGNGNQLDNIIFGNARDNTLTGAEGNDILDGQEGNNTLVGGRGNDHLIALKGKTHIIFTRGDGQDSVQQNNQSQLTLVLGQDIPASEVSLARNKQNLHIRLAHSNDEITLLNWFVSQGTLTIQSGDAKQLHNAQVDDFFHTFPDVEKQQASAEESPEALERQKEKLHALWQTPRLSAE